jgi:hypothetical protein
MAETVDMRGPWRAALWVTAATVLMAAIDLGRRYWELERRNAAYDYPHVRAEALRLLPEAPVVATWGVYDLPLSFYLGHRVLPVQTLGNLNRVMAEHPCGSAVLSQAALDEVADRSQLRVLPLDWLNFEPLVLVSYPDAAAPRAGSRP